MVWTINTGGIYYVDYIFIVLWSGIVLKSYIFTFWAMSSGTIGKRQQITQILNLAELFVSLDLLIHC